MKWRFDVCIQCERILSISLINVSVTSPTYLFFFLVRTSISISQNESCNLLVAHEIHLGGLEWSGGEKDVMESIRVYFVSSIFGKLLFHL